MKQTSPHLEELFGGLGLASPDCGIDQLQSSGMEKQRQPSNTTRLLGGGLDR